MKSRLIFLTVILVFANGVGRCERIKDIVEIQGVRSNPLTGVGLVIGLADTGDKTPPSQQMLTSILRNSGVVLDSGTLEGGNIALVLVTTELGPFARKGSRIDVDVSAVGDADSLQGGILLPTPLKGLDGRVYAVANGAISLGGWGVSGEKASIKKNHLTVGRIPGGATVEMSEIADFVENIVGQRFITLNLRNGDFSTAERISKVINKTYADSAIVIDAGTVKVRLPDRISRADVAGFIADITENNVKVDIPAVVVINERTGTIVVGENVGISSVAISQGSLVVKIKETQNVSQPTAMFSDAGETKVVDETLLGVKESEGYLIPIARLVTVSDLAKALNAIGATPTDLVAIFNALKKAGALQARLEIM
ncbi:MAG: flagellar biosynthesis protein FlgA [Planctomycetota bacterium]|nr:MAG: flagellar biosynthesis protein FlgA [Planctomycetota bacterium]